jgi:hypothetical protein
LSKESSIMPIPDQKSFAPKTGPNVPCWDVYLYRNMVGYIKIF